MLNRGYIKERIDLCLKQFIGRYQDDIDEDPVSSSQLIHDGREV